MEVSKMNNKKKTNQKYFAAKEKHNKLAKKILLACVLASVYAGRTCPIQDISDNIFFNFVEAANRSGTMSADNIANGDEILAGTTLTLSGGTLANSVAMTLTNNGTLNLTSVTFGPKVATINGTGTVVMNYSAYTQQGVTNPIANRINLNNSFNIRPFLAIPFIVLSVFTTSISFFNHFSIS